MNQQLSFLSSLLLDQADNNPDSAEPARQAAQDISAIRTPIINADTTAIQNVFMLIVRDIKGQGETIVTDSKAVSAEVMQNLRKELRTIQRAGLSRSQKSDCGRSDCCRHEDDCCNRYF